MYRFADPEYLYFLLLLPVLGYWYWRNFAKNSGRIRFSDINIIKKIGKTRKQQLRHSLFLLRLIFISLIILAFARPQSGSKMRETSTEGFDIILALDVSTSMLAEDFKPNRLGAVKRVAKEFIEGRQNDRIGLVIFAGESFTQCPLTLDYGVLLTLLDQTKLADREWDGTAIGMGIINAVNRLRDSKAKSKVIILLTDGVNNRGEVDPVSASNIAAALNIKIYTIGAGTMGTALTPIQDSFFGPTLLKTVPFIFESSSPLHPKSPSFIDKVESAMTLKATRLKEEDRQEVELVMMQIRRFFYDGIE
jgi:Ca-activated chloride channel family protein